jgi:hypothetical protein
MEHPVSSARDFIPNSGGDLRRGYGEASRPTRRELKCPPETGPKAYAPVSTVTPNANETPSNPILTANRRRKAQRWQSLRQADCRTLHFAAHRARRLQVAAAGFARLTQRIMRGLALFNQRRCLICNHLQQRGFALRDAPRFGINDAQRADRMSRGCSRSVP